MRAVICIDTFPIHVGASPPPEPRFTRFRVYEVDYNEILGRITDDRGESWVVRPRHYSSSPNGDKHISVIHYGYYTQFVEVA